LLVKILIFGYNYVLITKIFKNYKYHEEGRASNETRVRKEYVKNETTLYIYYMHSPICKIISK